VLKDEGVGANVLDGPVQALLHFVNELRAIPGAPALQAGDIITTGTLTDAWPVRRARPGIRRLRRPGRWPAGSRD
jgi:2-keto-4-pentenoate hydratase